MLASPRRLHVVNVLGGNQSGAALVVGLILLVAITLMAVASMNTATLDLIMAGNEQFRTRAFIASEIGIEQALLANTFPTSGTYPTTGVPASGLAGTDNDAYGFLVMHPSSIDIDPVPADADSSGGYGAVYWRINGSGTSERGAQAQTFQELYETVTVDGGPSSDPTVCFGTKDITVNCP